MKHTAFLFILLCIVIIPLLQAQGDGPESHFIIPQKIWGLNFKYLNLNQNMSVNGDILTPLLNLEINAFPITVFHVFSIKGQHAEVIAMMNPTSISPASLSGAIGIYTTNKSWLTAVFSKFYLKEDRWRVLVGAGLGNMNSQFLQSAAVNQFINYQTGATFFKLEVQRKIGIGLYLGEAYLYTEYNNEFEFETTTQEKVSLNGLGGVFVWDKRDDVYYPKTGHKMVFIHMSYPSFIGNDVVSNQINMQYNVYLIRRNNKDV